MNDRRTDRVFKALADRSRRKMLDLLAERPRTTGELAGSFGKLSRFAVMKHLRVLHRAGLIVISREGRKRWNSINAATLVDVLRRWTSRYEQNMAQVLLNIRDAAETAPTKEGQIKAKDDSEKEPQS